MRIRSQKDESFLYVTDKAILLLCWEDGLRVVKEYEIEQVLSSPETLIEEIPSRKIDVLIVPDYWIDNKFYPVSLRRSSIVETFLSRRLPIDYPEVPDLRDFFEYSRSRDDAQEGIVVYFIQEELFYRLYRAISFHLFIGKITAPAFLWQAKFARLMKEISTGQKLILHIYPGGSYLCFFSEGLFLFSRVIAMSQEEDYISQLSYEIMQSLRLFSQREKKEVQKAYLISDREEDKNKLAGSLDIEIEYVSEKIELFSPSLELISKLGSVAFLDKSDFSESARFLYIIKRQEKRLRRWSFFQNMGIAVGIVFFMLMLIEAIFLHSIIPSSKIKKSANSGLSSVEDYISAIDDLLYHKSRIDPTLLTLKIMDSLSEKVSVNQIRMRFDPSIALELDGEISASGTEEVEKKLSSFMKNLKKNILNAQIPSMDEVNIKKTGVSKFEFTFRFEINRGE